MPGSGAKASESASEGEIRAIIEARVEAVRAKDVHAAMSYHLPEAVLFDVIEPLRYMGASAGKKRAEEWFSSFEGPLGFEIRELNVTAGDGVAFSYGLNHVKGTKMDGGELDMWWRATVCYQRIEGKWTITHEHSSVPFDVTSGEASLDLKP
jgi:ketosteroid isomerase-like protein